MANTQANSSSSKPITLITVLKPVSIEDTPLLQHHNPIFDLQDSSSHKKFEAPNTMAEEGEHPNTKEPMNTQELLNSMVASQIQLREDMNLMMQQFQNLKSNQEENKADHNPPTMESEKKINKMINKMEEMIKRAHKMEDLMDYQSLSLFPDTRLPPKFKMPILDKFNGTSCPKSHLKMHMRVMQPLGATEELLAQMFQNTLTGAAFRWFLNLDDARARSWEDICHEFHNQYKYNIEVDITRRDLETMKQEPKKSFSTFIIKWRSKAAQMMNRPSEEEQLAMFVKNLLLVYHKYLFAQFFPNFKALTVVGTQIEDAINNGTIKNEDPPSFKKNLGFSSKTAEISNICKNDPYQLIAPIVPV